LLSVRFVWVFPGMIDVLHHGFAGSRQDAELMYPATGVPRRRLIGLQDGFRRTPAGRIVASECSESHG
jgi:hypothetical protein